MAIDYRVGDVFARMADIPDGSVSLVASSPPFIALRSYLPADHPDKALEIGSEPDPATFLDTLLRLTAEWGRVLAPWGSIAIELGDTYSGSNTGGDRTDGGQYGYWPTGGTKYNVDTRPARSTIGWPPPKCLALIPQLYATSLAYGRNLLTGDPSPAGQWLVRNVIVWHRPNPAVGALGDKVRPSTSYITVATRSPKRWFDLTAVRTAPKAPPQRFFDHGYDRGGKGATHDRPPVLQPGNRCDSAGAPPLDCWFDQHDTWTLPTSPSSLAHYAMWPPKLAERLILMMCPEQVCATCGEPRRRIERNLRDSYGGKYLVKGNPNRNDNGSSAHPSADYETLGWSECGHDNYRPGVVLDPFAGTGTSLAVAELHHRDSIGIDLDETNEALLPKRMEECRRVLFGTQPELPGQQNLFTQAAS